MIVIVIRKTYMTYYRFTDFEKQTLIDKLMSKLPALRGAAKAAQKEVIKIIGISRQTYNAVEMHKNKMSWNIYVTNLIFDYNPNTHYMVRQLDIFPYRLDECWLAGKVDQAGGE